MGFQTLFKVYQNGFSNVSRLPSNGQLGNDFALARDIFRPLPNMPMHHLHPGLSGKHSSCPGRSNEILITFDFATRYASAVTMVLK